MINPVSSADRSQPTTPAQSGSTNSTQSKPSASVPQQDVVQLSNTAKAAIQEAQETAFQTQREANHGDLQAKRLLATEAAAYEQVNKK